MIFLTVGHQTPFDRLVKSVDAWAFEHPDVVIFAQIGEGAYEPQNFPFERWLSAERFNELIDEASSVISHAGTGTIMQVLGARKPLLVLPRQAGLKETRNDHQWGTARYFAGREMILSIEHESELGEAIEKLVSWVPADTISDVASPSLIERLRDFAVSGKAG